MKFESFGHQNSTTLKKIFFLHTKVIYINNT
nr:MAG TPA: hypothetical protein [Caudoviricetes sp.]